jgi:uroporphyrinogen decarboxylase
MESVSWNGEVYTERHMFRPLEEGDTRPARDFERLQTLRKDVRMSVKPIRDKWEGKMTDRERFNAQMHYEPFDRCFNMEFGYWDENFKTWPMFAENGIDNNGDADVFLNFDRMAAIGGNIWMEPAFERKVIRETEDTVIIQNAEGLLAEMPKDAHSTIPHFSASRIKTPEDWKKFKEERFRRDDPARKIDVESLKGEHPPDRDYPLGVNCGSMIGKIRDLLTLEGLSYAVFDYPDMVEDMVETCCLLVEDSLDQLLPHFDFDFACGWEDISCNNGPLITMDFFSNVVVPRYKRIGKKLNEHGVDIWYTDSDGDVRDMIPGFLEAGLNTMFPWEVNGCGHPGPVLDEYGEQLRIMGGVNKRKLAAGRDAIKEELESLAPYVERGGYIPHCDHRCPPDVNQDDYLYYLDLKEEMFGL